MPTISPPTIAPSMRPTPPRMAAAKVGSRMFQPISDLSSVLRPRKKPDAAHRPPAMIQVSAITLLLSTPDSSARSGLSDMARMALPHLFLVRNRYSATTSAIATRRVTISWLLTRMPYQFSGRVMPRV